MAKSDDRRVKDFKEHKWENGYFYKLIVQEQKSYEMPLLESTCTFLIGRRNTASLTDGFCDEDIYKAGIPQINNFIETTIGSAQSKIMISVEKCLMTMKKGEVSYLALCIPDLLECNYSSDGSTDGDNGLRQSGLLFFCLILKDFTNTKPTFELTVHEKYNLALQHKEKGKELFQTEPELAFYKFGVAVKYLITIPTYSEVVFSLSGITPSEKEKYETLKCICYLNLAACQGIFQNHKGVIKNCTQALSIQPSNLKGLYRRGKAYLAEGQDENAR